MRETPFSKFMYCIRPLQEQDESIEHFTKRIFEIYTPYVDGDVSDIKRSDSTIKKYAYGSTDLSNKVAMELLKNKDEDSLAEFLNETDDTTSSAMFELFQQKFTIEDLSLHNIGEKASKLLTQILTEAASKKNKKSPQPVNAEDFIYSIKVENGVIVLGDSKLPLPIADIPSEEISEDELKLKYIYALMDAYNEAEETNIEISNRSNLKKKYREHFQEQRVNFYEAESLRNFSRDTISSDTDEFQKILDETYDGVINTSRRNYTNGYDRLLSVLEQVLSVK